MRQQLHDAIGAHGAWKARLRTAIEQGTNDREVLAARASERCSFGRWLQHMPGSDRDPRFFARVHELHEAFHREAAAVLDLARLGRHEEAARSLAPGADFDRLSDALTNAMLDWARAA